MKVRVMLLIFSGLILLSSSVFATIINVPTEQPTIQAGIDAASEGDTVLVADGTYTGEGNRDIDFGGKNIHLKSENGPEVTIIDLNVETEHRGFYFHSGETSETIVEGFNIRGGYSIGMPPTGPKGLGFLCLNSSPTIKNNFIQSNVAFGTSDNWTIWGGYGGALYCENSSAVIINNVITNNFASSAGGAIYCFNSDLQISGNMIAHNSVFSTNKGSAIYCISSNPQIINNTFTGNKAYWPLWTAKPCNGVIYCEDNSNPVISQNIIWGNNADQHLYVDETTTTTVDCNVIEGGWSEGNNFNINPLFCNPALSEYTLLNISPCAPSYNSCGVLIGAYDVACIDGKSIWYVSIDGDDLLGDGSELYPLATIQRGIDLASNGDTVLVASGSYITPADEAINFNGKNLVLMSVDGPEVTTITRSSEYESFILILENNESSASMIDGFTIQGGIKCFSSSPGIINCNITGIYPEYVILRGSESYIDNCNFENAGIICDSSDIIINNCVMTNSEAGIVCDSSNITVSNCIIRDIHSYGMKGAGIQGTVSTIRANNTIFYNNFSETTCSQDPISGEWNCKPGFGGAIGFSGNLFITNCSFISNQAGPSMFGTTSGGGAIYGEVNQGDLVIIENNIFYGNNSSFGGAIFISGTGASIETTCNDFYENGESPLVGITINDTNLFVDPLICDAVNGDFRISSLSQCAPSNNDCGVLIGARDIGCTLNYLCGDITLDNETDINDVVYLIDYYFNGGPPPPQTFNGDLNCDGSVNLTDLVYLSNYVLRGGTAECCQ